MSTVSANQAQLKQMKRRMSLSDSAFELDATRIRVPLSAHKAVVTQQIIEAKSISDHDVCVVLLLTWPKSESSE